MGVRLNKVIRELNIGLQTAVGFLEKKPELGEVKSEPSFKITDEQYQALVEEYKGDKAAKDQAGQLKKPKEKKPRPAELVDHKAETLLKDTRQKFTPLGKIVFGICLGVLTGLFRIFGGSAEGVSYAIIFSNLLVPLIERFTTPAVFGKGGKKDE